MKLILPFAIIACIQLVPIFSFLEEKTLSKASALMQMLKPGSAQEVQRLLDNGETVLPRYQPAKNAVRF